MDHTVKDKMRYPYQAPTQHVSKNEECPFGKATRNRPLSIEWIYKDLTEHRVLENCLQRESRVASISWEVLAINRILPLGDQTHNRCV
jgi:hypothetical protein